MKSVLIISMFLFALCALVVAGKDETVTTTDHDICGHVDSKPACEQCCTEARFDSGFGMASYGGYFGCACIKTIKKIG